MPGAKKAPQGDTRRRSQRRPYGEHGPGGSSPGRPGDDPGRFVVEESERAGLGVTKRRYGPGEIVFAPGDPDDRLHFLLEGALRTYKTYANSREATTALLKDHGVFGKPALTEGGGQDDFAEAVTEARVAGIRKSAVAGLARREPDLALALFSALIERLRLSDELVVTLMSREVRSRLVVLLLNLSERFGEEEVGEKAGVMIDLRLTHQDLANMIASTREAVSKHFIGQDRATLALVFSGDARTIAEAHEEISTQAKLPHIPYLAVANSQEELRVLRNLGPALEIDFENPSHSAVLTLTYTGPESPRDMATGYARCANLIDEARRRGLEADHEHDDQSLHVTVRGPRDDLDKLAAFAERVLNRTVDVEDDD